MKFALFLFVAGPLLAQGQAPCQMSNPTASFSVPYVKSTPQLNADPASATWKNAASAWMSKDCSRDLEYPDLKTEIKGFWTDTDLYLLFVCPYRALNLFLPAQNDKERHGLWDRDVVEEILGFD